VQSKQSRQQLDAKVPKEKKWSALKMWGFPLQKPAANVLAVASAINSLLLQRVFAVVRNV